MKLLSLKGKKVQIALMALLLLVGMIVVMPTAISSNTGLPEGIQSECGTIGNGPTTGLPEGIQNECGGAVEIQERECGGAVEIPERECGGAVEIPELECGGAVENEGWTEGVNVIVCYPGPPPEFETD